MRQFGQVDIPQSTFVAALRMGDSEPLPGLAQTQGTDSPRASSCNAFNIFSRSTSGI